MQNSSITARDGHVFAGQHYVTFCYFYSPSFTRKPLYHSARDDVVCPYLLRYLSIFLSCMKTLVNVHVYVSIFCLSTRFLFFFLLCELCQRINCLNENEWMNERNHEWMNHWMNQWADGRMNDRLVDWLIARLIDIAIRSKRGRFFQICLPVMSSLSCKWCSYSSTWRL